MNSMYRIKDTKEFKNIVSQKNKVQNSSYIIYYQEKAKEFARIGIATSKKLGKAHVRNYIRRQVRSMCQKILKEDILTKDIIIVVKTDYLAKTYEENEKELKNLVVRCSEAHQ